MSNKNWVFWRSRSIPLISVALPAAAAIIFAAFALAIAAVGFALGGGSARSPTLTVCAFGKNVLDRSPGFGGAVSAFRCVSELLMEVLLLFGLNSAVMKSLFD